MENLNIPELFGSDVFGDEQMRASLPKETYDALKQTILDGKELDASIAQEVAGAMKEWAVKKGATHFTHWFQPMTGITAEKHDSFLTPTADGKAIMEFSGKELIKGEADGSSFPTGGLRSMFEARGYTAWDPTSYAFVKDGSLCIPTVFCSYGGESLDKKTPLLRSTAVLSHAAVRLLKILGHDEVTNVYPTVGAEQEYFLVDKEMFNERLDLKFCGRTLFGAAPPKCQEMNDHYYGTIRPKVSEYMKSLDIALWKMGIPSKTKHNEVAPAQHELAPVFTNVNMATDNNQIMMEIMKNVAEEKGLKCLLHEKPFNCANGSGKHNNWSLQTSTGKNLLKPGKNPAENTEFLLLLCAVIKAVDMHQDLLRISVASAGNDCRLGGNEAPPTVVSMFIGTDLERILATYAHNEEAKSEEKTVLDTGAAVLPVIFKDTSDRNRTSPFAFTGNKFEFRMLGSSASIAGTNVVINTVVADVLNEFSDYLEKCDNVAEGVKKLISETYKKHKRIIFNGDGYSKEWEKEAERRGLINWSNTAEALPHYTDRKNVELFEKYGIYSETELTSRQNILLDIYSKTVHIEALTAVHMVKKQILPAISRYEKELCKTAEEKEKVLGKNMAEYEKKIAEKLSGICEKIWSLTEKLSEDIKLCENILSAEKQASQYRLKVVSDIEEIRPFVDAAEEIMPKDFWPLPDYTDLMFGI